MIDTGAPFVSLQSVDCSHNGLAPLLLVAKGFNDIGFELFEKVAFLLERGAETTPRDQHGNTCLHILFECYDSYKDWREELEIDFKKSLILLINAHADLYAVNYLGETVWDVVEQFGHEEVWIESLIECGYDPGEVYTRSYAQLGQASAVQVPTAGSPNTLRRRRPFTEVEAMSYEEAW